MTRTNREMVQIFFLFSAPLLAFFNGFLCLYISFEEVHCSEGLIWMLSVKLFTARARRRFQRVGGSLRYCSRNCVKLLICNCNHGARSELPWRRDGKGLEFEL
uniref:Uncharacterized protein n=1 Tax=Salix viminalis TaxID=40686 RepID=A0A6N2MNB0_SALVM